MTPYLRAHAAYHRHGPPGIPWLDAVDFHLQHGLVISDDRLFLMGRRVRNDASEAEQLSLHWQPCLPAHHTTWHIWAAAGDLRQLAALYFRYSCGQLTYQRRGRPLTVRTGGTFLARVAPIPQLRAGRTDPPPRPPFPLTTGP